jgi:flagellar biosynthetic protein FliP
MKRLLGLCTLLLAAIGATLLLTHPALAQSVSLDLGGGDRGAFTGKVIQLIALMTILSIAPGILVMVTSFTRIVVVLSILRSAIGAQGTPPNMVMVSLAMFLTAFVMAPTFEASYNAGIKPLLDQKIDEQTAFTNGVAPFKTFMLAQVREKDLALFIDMSNAGPVATPEDTPLKALIPAFMVSELRRAFEIGFLVYLPFLIIDMVVASVLMSMGMMMLPPVMIALPFKLIFFVMTDGWYLISGSLVRSFNPAG